ncbi:MAG: glutathione S-transferase [Gammaproteobacteria bacterium]|nr:glutathione S-transferase [Gammaproteobacteria bacterium]
MPMLVYTYFDFDGGRGEVARVAMHIAGIPFEDRRIPPKEWPARRDSTPFQAMPVLEVDGKVIAQSNTINRYVGKLAGLYPKDDWEAVRVDEVMDAVEDITTKIGQTMRIEDDAAKKAAREALVAGPLPRFLQQIEARLQAGGGEWFVENRLTVADLKCFYWVRWLKSGALDHIPADIVDKHAPLLAKHCERVKTQPKIAAYYAARGKA